MVLLHGQCRNHSFEHQHFMPNKLWSRIQTNKPIVIDIFWILVSTWHGVQVKMDSTTGNCELLFFFAKTNLVGGWATHLRNSLIELNHFPGLIQIEIYLKNIWNHHLAIIVTQPSKFVKCYIIFRESPVDHYSLAIPPCFGTHGPNNAAWQGSSKPLTWSWSSNYGW